MTAATAFARELVRVRRHSSGEPVPLTGRRWFRLAALTTTITWILVCAFTSLLAK